MSSGLRRAEGSWEDRNGRCAAIYGDDAVCDRPAGHYPDSLHIAHSPYADPQWIMFTEQDTDGHVAPLLVQSGSGPIPRRITLPLTEPEPEPVAAVEPQWWTATIHQADRHAWIITYVRSGQIEDTRRARTEFLARRQAARTLRRLNDPIRWERDGYVLDEGSGWDLTDRLLVGAVALGMAAGMVAYAVSALIVAAWGG